MAEAALHIIESDGSEREVALRLTGLGRRVDLKLLYIEDCFPIPAAFGLNSIDVLLSILSTEGKIKRYRNVARRQQIPYNCAIIRYVEDSCTELCQSNFEPYTDSLEHLDTIDAHLICYANAGELSVVGKKRSFTGTPLPQPLDHRWQAVEWGEFIEKENQVSVRRRLRRRPLGASEEEKVEEATHEQVVDQLYSTKVDTVIWIGNDGIKKRFIRAIGTESGASLFIEDNPDLLTKLAHELSSFQIPWDVMVSLVTDPRYLSTTLEELLISYDGSLDANVGIHSEPGTYELEHEHQDPTNVTMSDLQLEKKPRLKKS